MRREAQVKEPRGGQLSAQSRDHHSDADGWAGAQEDWAIYSGSRERAQCARRALTVPAPGSGVSHVFPALSTLGLVGSALMTSASTATPPPGAGAAWCGRASGATP